jgi:catechol 2,3-dioxygenase
MALIDTDASPYLAVSPERIGVRPPAFRLPSDTRIGRVTLQVADLERSLDFYRDVIGFRVIRLDDAGSRSALLGVRGDERVLLELREKPLVRSVPKRGRLGIYHFAVLLPTRGDLGRFLRHAGQRGVHIGAADHFYSEAAYLVDPDGVTIEVYRDRPRAEWVVNQEGEVVGTTEPLDFEDVLRETGADPYNGLPSGTTIGHMHFYVGDLARAEAFYHAALGFAKVNWSFPGALFVSAGAYHHHVGLNTWAAGSPTAGDDDAKLVTWELLLPDQATADAAADSLRHAGAIVTASIDGYLARDPWGIAVKIAVSGQGPAACT